jgi:hypothetical protein
MQRRQARTHQRPFPARRNGFDCQGLGPYPFRTGLTLLRAIVEQVRNGRQKIVERKRLREQNALGYPIRCPVVLAVARQINDRDLG